MNLKENENNYYTKELNDIDRYLLRIIKRYFDLESINNAASINAIVAEAIMRYKASIDYEMSDVSSLNNKIGIVNVNIEELNGEKKFEKLTAFNKNFGDKINTICEGNDKRLSDYREPKKHSHKITDVTNLIDTLDNIKKELTKYGYHLHINIAILNKLKYTGTKTQIDLVKLESLGSTINMLLNILERKYYILVDSYNTNAPIIDDIVNQIYYFMQSLYNYIEKSNRETNIELIEYIKQAEQSLKDIKENIVNKYSDNSNLESIKDILNNTECTSGYINNIPVASVVSSSADNFIYSNETSMQNFYDSASVYNIDNDVVSLSSDKDNWEYDTTSQAFIYKTDESKYSMLLSTNSYKNYVHEVTLSSNASGGNDVSIILAYNSEYAISLNISLNSSPKLSVMYAYNRWFGQEIAHDDTFNPTETEWNGNKLKIRIEKQGYSFKIYRSDLNSDVIIANPCISFELSYIFKETINESSQIGYGCYSQENSQFLNINFTSHDNINLTSDTERIEEALIPLDYVDMEIDLVYNNIKAKLPYITEDFIISAGNVIIGGDIHLYVKFQPLKSSIELPLDILSGKIVFTSYCKRELV